MTAGLAIHHLSHAYGNKKALDNVGFTVGQSTFCALLGPNGAGKSTLFSILTRLIVPNSGTVEIAGINLAKEPGRALAKLGVVFQQPTLDLDLTVKQNLSYFAALHGLYGKAKLSAIEASLEQLQMIERAGEPVRNLNGGHRRRMEIARALIHKPEILLLDEPTVGLDAQTRRAITNHVHALAQNRQISVLWATHLVDEVEPDDQLVILHQGKIIKDGRCSEIIGKDSLADTFARLTDADEPLSVNESK